MLADGWLYPLFVVGASRMRDVDDDWPAGHAHVDISLRAQADSTLVTITEDATAGPGLLVPKPLRDLQLHPRNVETLKRLAFVVEGRTR